MTGRMMLGARQAGRLVGFGTVAVALALIDGSGLAQGVDCDRLRAAIQSIPSTRMDDGARATQYARSAERQRYEIDRTRNYAESIGCNGHQFGLFDDSPPPQCDAIAAQIERMQNNLDQIEARQQQAGSSDDENRRADLIARYDAACASNPANLSQSPGSGFHETDPDGLRTVPTDPDGDLAVPLDDGVSDDQTAHHGAGKAICVRTCDGGYFPITQAASHGQLNALNDLCKASCPNTEAALYTLARGDDLSSATALDGTPYTSLPNAFRFEKSFTAACTCKPADQSWAQALAGAERLLEQQKGDITVTERISDQLSKSKPPPSPANGKARASRKATPSSHAVTQLDQSAASGGPSAASAATPDGPDPTTSKKKGGSASDAVRTPDGATRKVRIIAP